MKYIQVLLVVVVLTFASGAISSAYAADHHHAIVFTPSLRGDHFACNAVNTTDDSIDVQFTISDENGSVIPSTDLTPNPSAIITIPALATASLDTRRAETGDGYCKVEVWGEARDVRVVLTISLIRTFTSGSIQNIPVFVFRQVEGR